MIVAVELAIQFSEDATRRDTYELNKSNQIKENETKTEQKKPIGFRWNSSNRIGVNLGLIVAELFSIPYIYIHIN